MRPMPPARCRRAMARPAAAALPARRRWAMPAFVNLNARLYNPTLGRFVTADPTRQNLYDLQELNPYACVDDNPLSLTDPTGYGGKGGFFKTALFRQLVAIAAAALLDEFLLPVIETAALGSTVAGSSLVGVAN